MSARMWFTDAQSCNQGMVYLDFSFQSNGANDPLPSTFRGVAPVKSVTRVGQNTGTYLVTLMEGYRFNIAKDADL